MPLSDATPERKGLGRLRREELWHQLEFANNKANKQDQIVWTVFTVFMAANTALVVVLFQTGKPSPIGLRVISAVAVVISTIWFIIQQRAIGHQNRFEATAHRLEEELDIPPNLSLSARRNFVDTRLLPALPVRELMTWLPAVVGVLWFGILYTAFFCPRVAV